MGTNWETAADELEKLLEFDGDVDSPSAPTAGWKEPLSNTPSTSASIVEPRSFPNAANPRNSPEQLQAGQNPATEDGDKSTSIDKGNEETGSLPSLCKASGGHDISHSLRHPEQDLNEERSDCHEKRSQDGGMHYSNEEEAVSSKKGFSRDVPGVRPNVEETDDEDEEHDVRLLSGVGRDRRVAIGGYYGSSRETRGRASKRIRKDSNAGTGWDDPILVDDFAKGGMDYNEGEVPQDGRSFPASPLLSSRELPPVQEAAEDRHGCNVLDVEFPHTERDCSLERETSPLITVLGYKIPGPAGALQNCLTSAGKRTHGLGLIERHFGPGRPSHRPTAAADTLDFREGPWLAAVDFLDDGNQTSRSTIVTIKATKRHIPQLVAIINTAVPNSFGDLSVTLKDPTGTIGGTIHRKVLTELEDGHLIVPGAVIIIRKVAVFSPTPFAHYLNITVNNVDQIFGKDTIAPRRRGKAVNDGNYSGTAGSDHPISEPGSDGMSQMQTAAKERYQSETTAPNFGISEKQGVTEVTHGPGNDEGIQADCPNDKSPGSGKSVRKSLPLTTILGDGIDSRKSAATTHAGDSDARASQDAIAKAAGWDFSEDVELLLADDDIF